jgi:hypothetical protein
MVLRAVTMVGELLLLMDGREFVLELAGDSVAEGPWPEAEMEQAVAAFHRLLRQVDGK